jgi:hypothetical protein
MIFDSRTTQNENIHEFSWNMFIISIHGLVYLYQNTKHFFVEFPETKDATTLKQHQQFFWSALTSSVMMSMLKSYPSHVLVLFSNEMDGLWSTYSRQKSLCMVMAFNKSSNNTVMRERMLNIVFLNDVFLESAISTLTASQNTTCPYLIDFWQIVRSSIQFKPS